MGRERGQINLADQLQHAPAEDLIVIVLAGVVDELLRVHVHQHRVDVVAQAGHLGLLELVGLADWEVDRRTKHLMHVFGATVRISVYRPHQRPVVEELSLLRLTLSPRLELLADTLVLLAHFKRETALFLPAGPLRLVFLDNVDERLPEGALSQHVCLLILLTQTRRRQRRRRLLICLCQQFDGFMPDFVSESGLVLAQLEQVALLQTNRVRQGLGEDNDLDHEGLPENRVIHLKREQGQLGEELGVLLHDAGVRLLNAPLRRLEIRE